MKYSILRLLLVPLLIGGCAHTGTNNLSVRVNALADRYYEYTLQRSPETAYFNGIDIDRHDGLYDNRPDALRAGQRAVDGMLATLSRIDSAALAGEAAWITRAYLHQILGDQVALRVCRRELWNVNQMDGWQLNYPTLATLQPVGSPVLRQQALARWAQFPQFIRQEIENLRVGLNLGYSAPRSVVRRVIAQIDGLLAVSAEQSPFFSMAQRDGDETFSAAMRSLLVREITPALQEYRDYLAGPYLRSARTQLTVTANPDGRACYDASLRAYTTLDRSGEDVFALGSETVAENRADVSLLGHAAYGADSFDAIIAAARSDPAERFESREELLAFSRAAVHRADTAIRAWVGRLPAQAVVVVPFPEHEEGTGRSAHYRPGNAQRAAEYRIPLYQPEEQIRGNAEATAFHETWPGHHLQVATAQTIEGLHPVTNIIWFSGPGEGWARYSEALAEEMGLYTSRSGPILRRAWPARGMVVDPGIHLFEWTAEQAVAFMAESGRFPRERAVEMVDRIAVLPGQLTAYDSGGLEILALRRAAKAALGDAFDIRDFHDRVLEIGTIPLPQLREHIEAWIAAATD